MKRVVISGLGIGMQSTDLPMLVIASSIILSFYFAGLYGIAIASLGMLQILISFPSTYFFYRLIFQIEHFGTLQVLAIYVILGIGADDIFVLDRPILTNSQLKVFKKIFSKKIK